MSLSLTYEAIDTSGKPVRDLIMADSSKAAVEQLRQKGLMVTNITEATVHEVEKKVQLAEGWTAEFKLPLKQLLLFTRQMSMLLKSGSALVPALAAIGRQMKHPKHVEMIRQLRDDLEEGAMLGEAMCRFPRVFDASYCAIIAAGESSATLPEMFDRLSQIIGKRRALRNKVLGAMTYPVLLMGLATAQVNVLLFFVLPRFGEMFASLGAPLPSSTKLMLDLSGFLRGNWVLVVIGVGTLLAGVVFLAISSAGRRTCINMQTQIPVLGRLATSLIQGQVFRTLGMLLEAHVAVLEALELTRRVTKNNRFQILFDRMENAVTSGNMLSDAMESSNLVAPALCQAVRTGEESGNLGGAISYAADILDEDNVELVGAVTRLIEPAIIILMGVVVGAVAISLFLPMFDITSMTQ